MNPATPGNKTKAFTLIEFFVVIALIAVLVTIFLPYPRWGTRQKAGQIFCMSNLRQINLGFLMYRSDYQNRFSWQYSTNQGGTEELIPNGLTVDHFLKLTNYLHTARTFLCPYDKARLAANSFIGLCSSNVSYFVALDAITNNSLSILSGDRHLSLSNQPVKSGLCFVTNSTALGWTRELHIGKKSAAYGNLGFLDGHVEHVRNTGLPAVFQRQLLATNRLAIP